MTPEQIQAATRAVRRYANESGYGFYITDKVCEDIAKAVLATIKLPPSQS